VILLHTLNLSVTPVASLPALGPWAPPAERGPSQDSIYRVSLAADLCEGKGRKLAAFIAPLSATIPAAQEQPFTVGLFC